MGTTKSTGPDPSGVRDARPQDLPRLLQLEALFPGDRLAPRQFRRHLASPRARLRVALHDGVIVAYALTLLRRGSARARLYSIAVEPAARGLGLGAQLLDDAMRQAAAAGCGWLQLEVREDNAAAIALYRRLGFVEFGCKPGYYEDGATALRFERATGVGAPA